MYDIFVIIYGLALAFGVYSYTAYRLQIPGGSSKALVRRIQDLNLSEREVGEKYKPLHEKIFGAIAMRVASMVNINKLSRMELQEKLNLAGIKKTPEEFLAKRITMALWLFSFSILWVLVLRTPLLFLPGLLLAFIGFNLPAKDLDKKISEKKNRIIMELPDFLDMLVLSLRAGRNLYTAIRKAAEQSGPNLRPLLEKLQADVELVENKKDALWEFAERTGLQEVKDFVSALEIGMDAKAKQAEEIYRSQSKTMRTLRTMALKKQTSTVPQKLSMLHIWLYINCIGVPIIASILQFGSTFQM